MLFAGCKGLPKNQEKQNEASQSGDNGTGLSAPMKIPVGSVLSVHPEGGFALIKSSRSNSIEPGTSISTFDSTGGQTSSLQVSNARKGPFLTADIISGNPTRGDQAVMDFVLDREPSPDEEADPVAGDDIQVLE